MLTSDRPLTAAQEAFLFIYPTASASDLDLAEKRHQQWWFREATLPLENKQRMREYNSARAALEQCVRVSFRDKISSIERQDPIVVTALAMRLHHQGMLYGDKPSARFLHPVPHEHTQFA